MRNVVVLLKSIKRYEKIKADAEAEAEKNPKGRPSRSPSRSPSKKSISSPESDLTRIRESIEASGFPITSGPSTRDDKRIS